MVTKEQLLARKSIDNQAKLVKALLNEDGVKPIKRFNIPNGINFHNAFEDKAALERAFYAWLRAQSKFSSVKLCMSSNDSKYRFREERLVSWSPPKNGMTYWEVKGKEDLAKQMSAAVLSGSYLWVEARADGIYGARLSDKDFGPYRLATQKDVEDEKTLVAEQNEERKAGEPEFETTLSVGDSLPHEDWDPHLEFGLL